MLYYTTQYIKFESLYPAAHQAKSPTLIPYRTECSFTVPSSHPFLHITFKATDKTVATLKAESSGFYMKLNFPLPTLIPATSLVLTKNLTL